MRIEESQPAIPVQPIRSEQEPVPLGISAEPTTLTSEPESSCSPRGFCSAIGEFFYSTSTAILGAMTSFFDFLTSLVCGNPPSEALSSDDWMLSEDIENIQLPQESPPAPSGTLLEIPSQPLLEGLSEPTPPPVISVPNLFSSLPITNEEKEIIYDLIHKLGTTSLMSLALPWNQSALRKLGAEIEHVHPFKFLEYILRHRTLRTDLDTIHNSNFIWPDFLNGLSGKMERERAGLPHYLPGFARSMGIDLSQLQPFLESKDWQAMVFFLLDVKLGRMVLPPITPLPIAPLPTVATPSASETPPAEVTLSPSVETPSSPSLEKPISTWNQIALSDSERGILDDLVQIHRTMGYWSAVRGDRHVNSLWDSLNKLHPLALLAYLFSDTAVVSELKLLWPYNLHRYYFTTELVALLNRRSEVNFRPYTRDFVRIVGKDIEEVTHFVYARQWRELIDVLMAPSD
jgi:hypothetical protein